MWEPPTEPAERTAYMQKSEQRIKEVGKQVRWWKVDDAHMSILGKLEVNILPGSLAEKMWEMIDTLLQGDCKAEIRQGLAPRTDMARKVQDAYDSLNKNKGKGKGKGRRSEG